METALRLRIVLENPPANLDYGLQKGSGSNYETIQKQRSKTQDLYFEFNLGLKNNNDSVGGSASAMPIFVGPLAQGPPRERFIYLDIGTLAGQSDSSWSSRLKIPLVGITGNTLQQLLSDSSLVLESRVAGTDKNGKPTSGTAKPFNGWKLVKQ